MPTGNAIADSSVRNADTRGENAVQNILSSGFLPNVDVKPTMDPSTYISQSKDIFNAGFKNSGIPELFGQVQRSGNAAASSLDIVEEKFKQDELKRVPIDSLQAEVDDLQTRRMRVLPEVLADPGILDYSAKLQIASKIQSMFDSEIEKTLTKKSDLEAAAASRAKLKADTLRSQADVLDKKMTNDRFLLTSAIDMFQAGTGTLQDILEKASDMQMSIDKARKSGNGSDSNPFLGMPQNGFADWEVAIYLKADKNYGRLDVPDSVSKNQKIFLNDRYYKWQQNGKPVPKYNRASGPADKSGNAPFTVDMLSGDAPGVNTFPQAPNGDSLVQALLSGGGEARPVGEDVTAE